MSSINVHIDERMKRGDIEGLRQQLLREPHVSNVEMRSEMPHDMLVEFEAHHAVPLHVLEMLRQRGLHADIVGC